MQTHFRGSLEELSCLGFEAREVPHPDASAEHRAAIRARNEALARMQGTGLPLRGSRSASAQPTPRPRPRGAGRPARRAGSSSTTASSDPGGGDDPDDDADALPLVVTPGDAAQGNEAVARTFERILAQQHPGTTWSAS
jgi:hypothetical protein